MQSCSLVHMYEQCNTADEVTVVTTSDFSFQVVTPMC